MFKLYKTKSRLSNVNSFYVLTEANTNESECESIWFDRQNGEISIRKFKRSLEYEEVNGSPVYGYIGKFQVNQNYAPKLIFIKSAEKIGKFKVKNEEHSIYKIKEILLLTFTPPSNSTYDEIECDVLMSDQFTEMKTSSSFSTLGSLITGSPVINSNSTEAISRPVTNNNINSKFEKKVLIEVYKIFQDNSGSFYFSDSYDLTNTIERQEKLFEKEKKGEIIYDWRQYDDRFFWNKYLVQDLLNLNNCDKFVVPIIQGFIQIELFDIKQPNIEFNFKKDNINIKNFVQLKLTLFSRRSRYRLGTRFKRRGIDENGNVANFVETEQIVNVYDSHTLSFVQIRGSIPIYWSQPGIKYRPAPRIDRSLPENKIAFRKHFDQIEKNYSQQKRILLINLVEETGKESLLGDAYIEQLAELNNPKIIYVQFDFHEHCKGLKFENVSILKERLKTILSDQSYCWVDKQGFVYEQKNLLRVNCIDCLDRTNVVQMVMAKFVLENQLQSLGILAPYEAEASPELPLEFRKKVWSMWANNGDAISEQYAGTSALKGDYTRTGERNFTGILKDGMNSANRYYLRFRDAFRQIALDVLQGIPAVEEEQQPKSNLLSPTKNDEQLDDQSVKEREENVRQLLDDCKKELVGQDEDCYGRWALINYNESSSSSLDINQVDPDVFLLFTKSALYISNYDDTIESFVNYQKIDLEKVEKLELGPEPEKIFFKATPRFHVLRIYYKDLDSKAEPYSLFHSFRSCNLRFFNNLVLTTNSNEELTESLRGICQTIQSTAEHFQYKIEFSDVSKLARKDKSRPHTNIIQLSNLTTRMSLEEIKAPSDSKILKIGKMIGNKFFKKNPSPSNQTVKKQDENLISFDDGDNLDKNDNSKQEISLIEFENTTPSNEDCLQVSQLQREKSSNSLNSMTNVSNTPRLNNNNMRTYMPKLALRQYSDREDKLKFTKEIITKNSKTNFIFI